MVNGCATVSESSERQWYHLIWLLCWSMRGWIWLREPRLGRMNDLQLARSSGIRL